LIGIFVFLLASAVFSAVPAFAAAITVTNQADSGPGSLRDAIAAAAPGDTINFSLTLPATITLTSGELLISKNLTISGPGASNLAISGMNASRVFEIGSGFTVAISGLTIQNGSADTGGGIFNVGTLMLSNSTVSSNSVSGNGGGIYNNGTLTMTNSTLSGNSAKGGGNGGGGGIFNYFGTLVMTNSTLSGNSAVGFGFNAVGAGVYIYAGTVTVTNSTLSGNSAGVGGGIYTYGATVTLSNSTLSGNSASYYGGGGIFVYNGSATSKNTIWANNSLGNCGYPGMISQGYNLSDDTTCSSSLTQTGDLNNTPAGLDPSGLKNNGGPTQTIALLATSTAVNAIPLNPTNYCTDVNGAPVTTDQRGFARPGGLACDIGAFELGGDDDSGLAQLNGSNTFTGNQTVNGNVSATNFVGNGAGLTGVITGVTAGAGLTGGGTGGNVGLSLASASCAAGSAITAHPFTCTAFPTFGANTFTGNQTMPNLTVPGAINSGSINSGVGFFFASSAVALAGSSINSYGVGGTSTSSFGVFGSSNNSYGVYGASNSGTGVYGTTAGTSATTAAAVFNNAAAGNAGNILLGQSGQVTKFSIDSKGDVAASGSVTIGGGTPILEHLSGGFVISLPAMKPSTCTTFNNSFNPLASEQDTIVLGVGNSLMSAGPAIIFSAWVSAPGFLAIRVCNVNPNGPPTSAVNGGLRVDLWKH
jgi:hypothetical protein